MKRILLCVICAIATLSIYSQSWPKQLPEARPGTRWWWFGSAVDSTNLKWNLSEYASHGIGAVEITPIYGVQGNEKNELRYLSPEWMKAIRYTECQAKANNIEVDMATGTGWPFGGPWVPINEAACKAVFVDTLVNIKTKIKDIAFAVPNKEKSIATLQKAMEFKSDIKGKKRVIALYISRTRQMVKRAAPGGEGYVIDHFDKNAVMHYLAHIDSAFNASNTPYPHTFFNDSYEVFGADWTPTLLDEFAKRRGYKLETCFDKLLDGDSKTLSDYRETLSDMLLENFTNQWTAWAHSHGAITRNQAHGSPANLIDCYASVDIPEIEGFGLSNFGIKGLRKDPGMTRTNFSDLSMLKYAPSAAHITGKQFTSSETFTWLTEHFRTSLSQMKPDMDLMFCAGVNHMFFHGTPYSPKDAKWPGWKFYASVDMSPTNSIWRDAPYLMSYITRCQSFLQWGQPDNDFIVYLPVRDMWRKNNEQRLMQFDIHSMAKKAPEFIKAIMKIDSLGYDCDYISDRYLLSTTCENGVLKTVGGTKYKALIIPGNNIMTPQVKAHLAELEKLGAHIIIGVDSKKMSDCAVPEQIKLQAGIKMIRRSNPTGYHYFMSNLTPNDIDCYMPLATEFKNAAWFNPMNGDIHEASIINGKVRIKLRSGESAILQTYRTGNQDETTHKDVIKQNKAKIKLTNNKWQLSFIEEAPKVSKTYNLDSLQYWQNIDNETAVTMGTGVYTTSVKLNNAQSKMHWSINLGDVRESARVYINGEFIGCSWAVPYILDCKNLLHKGNNTIRIEVTNLPANRISNLDKQGVKWRKMKEINIVDLNYQKTTYADWKPVDSGINNVTLTTDF